MSSSSQHSQSHGDDARKPTRTQCTCKAKQIHCNALSVYSQLFLLSSRYGTVRDRTVWHGGPEQPSEKLIIAE